jgi:hypothetical protein
MPNKPIPRADYPNKAAWMANLNHSSCTQDREGNCYSIHCVFCGADIGGGYVRCRCDGATKAWEGATR